MDLFGDSSEKVDHRDEIICLMSYGWSIGTSQKPRKERIVHILQIFQLCAITEMW